MTGRDDGETSDAGTVKGRLAGPLFEGAGNRANSPHDPHSPYASPTHGERAPRSPKPVVIHLF